MEKIITQFNKNGYAIISILDQDQLLDIKNMIKERIIDLLEFNSVYKNKINLEEYHKWVSDKNHSLIVELNTRYIALNDRFNNIINNNISINKILFHLWKHNRWSIKWIGSYLLQKELLDNSCAFRIARPYSKYKNDVGGVHLDLHYGGKIRTNILSLMTLWIPIIGFSEKYTLRIAPGSHKKQHPVGEIIKQNEYISPVMNKNYIKTFSYIRPRLKKGQGILMHPNLLHGASYNHGVNTRFSLDIRIFNEKFLI